MRLYMYNIFLKKLQAADKSQLKNVIQLLDIIKERYKFNNNLGQPINILSYKINGDKVALLIRYVSGLKINTLKHDISELALNNKTLPSYHVADLYVDTSVKSTDTLWSEPGYSALIFETTPIAKLNIELDGFEFFNSILQNIQYQLRNEIENFNNEHLDSQMKYVVEYKAPENILDEVYFKDNRLSSTSYDAADIIEKLRSSVVISRGYFIDKIRTSPKLLNLGKFTELTFDIKLVQRYYNELVDIYWSTDEFKNIFKYIVYNLNMIYKQGLTDDLSYFVERVCDDVLKDPILNGYIDQLIEYFVKKGDVLYDSEANDYTNKYIDRFFQLFEEFILKTPFKSLKSNSKYAQFLQRFAIKVSDYIDDESRLNLERLMRELKDKGSLTSEELNTLNNINIDTVGLDDEQKKQIEEVRKNILVVDHPEEVDDESEVAKKLYDNDELILEEFGESGVYSQDAKDAWTIYLSDHGYTQQQSGEGYDVVVDINGNKLEKNQIESLLDDFKASSGLENEQILHNSDQSDYQVDDDKQDNYMLNRAHSPKLFNFFGGTAENDRNSLRNLLKYNLSQLDKFNEHLISKDELVQNVYYKVYTLPVDHDLAKSLMYACVQPIGDSVVKWLEHLNSIIALSIQILNIFINSEDSQSAMRKLKALFNEKKSLERYFLKSELQAIDTSILDRVNFVNDHKEAIDVKNFLNFIGKISPGYKYKIENDKVKFILKPYNKKVKVQKGKGIGDKKDEDGNPILSPVIEEKSIKDYKKVNNKNEIQGLIDQFNTTYSKNLTYDKVFNTKINFTELQTSRPLSNIDVTDKVNIDTDTDTTGKQVVREVAVDNFILSLNNEGLNRLTDKLNALEVKVNKLFIDNENKSNELGGVDVK